MLNQLEPVDLLKQVEDHDECEWLLTHLPPITAVLMWDHYALGIPTWLLARREGMSVGTVLLILDRGLRRLRVLCSVI